MLQPPGADPLHVMHQWKRDLYLIQLQAPTPMKIECHIDIPTRPEFYGNEFHGDISRHETDELLYEDGCYLVRESHRNPGCYTLAIRFDNATKNYKLYYDMNLRQHYVGDKHFDNLNDLVADGLICFYVHLKAAGYIASMNTGDESVYEESPYMRYRRDMASRQQRDERATLRGPAPDHRSTQRQNITSSIIAPAGGQPPLPARPHSTTNGSIRRAVLRDKSAASKRHVYSAMQQPPPRVPRNKTAGKRQAYSTMDVPPPRPPAIPSDPPPINRLLAGDGLDGLRNPSAILAGEWMDIMQQEKTHNFKTTTFKSIANCWCEFCFHFMWGLIQQGVECQDCGFRAHKKCSEKLPNDCMPNMKKLKRMFGLDLTTLLKATNKSIPYVVEKCVEEIERRGLHHEGLYRVAGFHDNIEDIRKEFDLDGDADITEKVYSDINTITSVLKLFFRQLPVPLITVEVYPKLTGTVNDEGDARQLQLAIKSAISPLPTSHFQTLKYLIGHLNRVTQHTDKNKMSAENLAIVFAPTILQSPQNDPMAAIAAGRIESRVIEALILNYIAVFEK